MRGPDAKDLIAIFYHFPPALLKWVVPRLCSGMAAMRLPSASGNNDVSERFHFTVCLWWIHLKLSCFFPFIFYFFSPQRTIHLVVLCIISWLGSALFFVLKISLSISFPWMLPAVLPAQMIHPEVCLPLLFCFCCCAVGHPMVPFINLYSFFWCKDLIAFRLEPRAKRLEPVASLLPKYLIMGLCSYSASQMPAGCEFVSKNQTQVPEIGHSKMITPKLKPVFSSTGTALSILQVCLPERQHLLLPEIISGGKKQSLLLQARCLQARCACLDQQHEAIISK